MEQAGYWMWTKRKHGLSTATTTSHVQASTNHPISYGDSWEEQAFAEDAASGSLGGCIWPPRSYSCSFCKREFRSAQALGGHMNVHRRDRARLKQSPLTDHPHNEINQYKVYPTTHNDHQHPSSSLGFQYPSQVCTFVYNPNPNSDHRPDHHHQHVHASPSSLSRVSSAPPPSSTDQGKYCIEQQFLVPAANYSSSIIQEQRKRPHFSPPPSNPKAEGEKPSRFIEPAGCWAKGDYIKPADLSVGLNFFVRRSRQTVSSGGMEETISSSKRRRADSPSILSPFFLKPSSGDRHQVQPEMLELRGNSFDELDLELRLGERPN